MTASKRAGIATCEDYGDGQQFHADVVIVGTGAGGAPVGALLAEAGLDVLFIEEGSWTPTSEFNPYVAESSGRLYRDGGATVIFGKPNITYVEGRTVGGSTAINGGMCYRTPDEVLHGWQRELRSDEFSSTGLERYFEATERDVHAKHQLPESVGGDNHIMRQGAEKLGWKWQENRRNQDRCVGSNNCVLGCPTGGKQSTLVSYMPRAMRAGARCLTEIRVDKLVIEDGRAVGVTGRAIDPRTRSTGARVTARGAAVVIACGAVQTPFLLLRHRLGRQSGQLGRNFTCHPNAKVMARYPHQVSGWKGVSQWGQIREFHEDGLILAANFIPPAAMAGNLPFLGSKAGRWMRHYDRCVVSGVLVEDSTTGRVHRGPLGLNPFDMPVVRYDITPKDHQQFLRGVRLLGELHFAMGAEELLTPFTNVHTVATMDELDRALAMQTKRSTMELFTPHLMGTARLSSRAGEGVIDPDHQLWDLPGCYVSDASVFPSPVGVNPQITIMALALRMAERLGDRLLTQKARMAKRAA